MANNYKYRNISVQATFETKGLCITLTHALRFFELPISHNFNAGEGIRTPERLHEQILSLPPLTAWLLPRFLKIQLGKVITSI